MLSTYMGLCAQDFEKLPIVNDAGIIRNVLYSGIWMGFRLKAGPSGDKEDRA